MRAVIRGTGMYVPPNVVDNHRLSRLMETSDEWIRKRTGIVTRHYAGRDQATSDMAVPAAQEALREAGVGKDAIDYVLFATMSPDFYFPGSAPIFQHKFGLSPVPCLDIRQQCSGFLYGLQLADAMIRSGQYRTVLLVGAEVHTCFMPWRSWDVVEGTADRKVPEDEYAWNTRFRDRVVLFGDGAGAFVLSAVGDDASGLEDVMVQADGQYADRMWVRGGGSAFRPYFEPRMFESGDCVPFIEGREVFRMAVTLMPEAVNAILARNGYVTDDLDLLIMHQANLRINEAAQKALGLPDEKVHNNIQRYGNTTSATLPLCFHEARAEGRIAEGDLVAFTALGAGMHWGSVLMRV
jgi:3-oxoacyl-[acyl-carrier-protein] synthase-3